MTVRQFAIFSLAFLLPLSLSAQKKKKRPVKKPVVVVVEEPQEDPRITNMREMTQQIVIIDSIVTDKSQFLSHYILSSETGKIMTANQFKGIKADGYIYLNEMGNKAYFGKADKNGVRQIFTSDKLGDRWGEPILMNGLSEGIDEADYPFMMNDGITFYFAARGEESIGGYDIFFTRYDSRSGAFLKPENIGMPFNSEANDYMYAADEQSGIGYFVSDRRQPEGKVCVYIFILPDTRRSYDPSRFTEQQIRDFADITRIADTWGNGSERRAALERLKAVFTNDSQPAADNATEANTAIVINDRLTYSSVRDFRSPTAANHYRELLKARERLSTLEAELQKSRDRYVRADENGRSLLRDLILHNEEQSLMLRNNIRSLEKQIRNEENNIIK
ncbi:MAG: hypothetical protein K6E15_03980 [Prevotella sp.]|nr:hypothetical protein [Prevotella sp.]